MNRPSSQYLTYPYPAWSGCTLNEILVIWGICLVGVGLMLGVVALIIGRGFVGLMCFLLWFPITMGVVKQMLRTIEPIKEQKQTGYFMIKVRLFLAEHAGFSSPYLTRVGQWITRC